MVPLFTIKDFLPRVATCRLTRAVNCGNHRRSYSRSYSSGGWFISRSLKHQHFTTLSENNRVKIVPDCAYARAHFRPSTARVLAQNLPAFSLEVVPEVVDDIDTLIARAA